ncbi:MAG: PAS domain S-box protein [Rhodospirillales bacterium]|nr:PAS domain S-box protein [Rhodospirillales bacterium]
MDKMIEQSRFRAVMYGIACIGLLGVYGALRGLDWHGTDELHSLMEAVATVLAAIVGVMALIRHYARPNTAILLVGAGFTVTAFLDGSHAIVTAAAVAPYLPSDMSALVPWSWLISRIFLSFMLMLSSLTWRRDRVPGVNTLLGKRYAFFVLLAISITFFLFFVFVPLQSGYFRGYLFPRPQELVPLLFLSIALVGYLRQGNWKSTPFEHWLVMSLIIGVVGQLVMPGSAGLYDLEFDVAHLLKISSYICVLVGLLISMFEIYREAEVTGQHYSAVFESAVDGVITIDQTGIMETFNPAAEEIFGYQADECIGQNVKMLMPDPDHSGHDGYIGNYLRTGQAKIIGLGREVVGLHRSGREFPMDLSVGHFRLGNQIMFVGICRDITVRRRAQDEIIAVNMELESFSYSVSHDLRAPLRAIDGFSQALLDEYHDRLDENGIGYLSRVMAGAQRMGRLIDDLLNLSRVTRRDLVRESVDLSELASHIADDLRTQDPERRVEFVIAPNLRA